MRLTDKKILEVVSEVAGEDIIGITNLLKNNSNYSELKLADKLKLDIKIVRNQLYRLFKYDLVFFTRKKDRIKGWYIYYWTLKPDRIKTLFVQLKVKRFNYLKEKLQRELTTQFYICPNKCMRLDFDKSFGFEYRCPECGELFGLHDNREYIKNIKKEIIEIEKFFKEEKLKFKQ